MGKERDRAPRWNALLSLIAERGRLSVTEACELLDASPATVRRDFTELAAQQLVTRTHGGVVANAVAYDLPARYKAAAPDSAKERIAHVASRLVRPGSVVGFNGGTTTTATARHLATRPEIVAAGGPGPTTIVTNALNIANEMVLRASIRCVTLGGVARAESFEQTGSLAVSVMRQLWLDLLVLGVDGLHATHGATCTHEDEAGVNAAMVERAERVIVVATGDKIGTTTFARICATDSIAALVTDHTAPPDATAALKEAGIEVIVATPG